MHSIKKTVIFSQIDGRFSTNSPIAGLLHIEGTDEPRDGIRIIFSNVSPTAASKWYLVVKCGDKMLMNDVSLPQDYFLTERLNVASVTEAVLIGEEDNRRIPVAYASSAGGSRESFIRQAVVAIEGKEEGKSFYKEKAAELLAAFTKNRPYAPLIKAFSESYWVKIDKGEAFYLQGIILRGDKPLYICFAMPEKFMKKSDDLFVYFPYKGNSGYFVAFQDAFTGRTVKPDIEGLLCGEYCREASALQTSEQIALPIV